MKERIKELCKINDVSMNKLEEILGFGKGYISKLGKSTPNTAKIKKIADYFNVSVEYLLTGKERKIEEKYYLNDETIKIAQKIFNSKELQKLFNAAQDAAPEDLETAHTIILALKRKAPKEN